MAKKIESFKIRFSNDRPTYTAGERLLGDVMIANLTPIFARDLKVTVHGRSEVDGGAKTELLNEETSLISKEGQLCEGEHEFVFRAQLKDDLPTSIEHKFGSVRFTCKAVLRYSDNEEAGEVELTARKGFTVVRRGDINKLSSQLEPNTQMITHSLGLFACTSGQIRFNITSPRTAYVAGENVTIAGTLENSTSKRIDKVTAGVEMQMALYGLKAAPEKQDHLSTMEDSIALYVDPGAKLRISRNLALPALLPSTVGVDGDPMARKKSSAGLELRVNYEIVFSIYINGQAETPLHCRMPLFVGTEALRTDHRRLSSNRPSLAAPVRAAGRDADAQVEPLYRQPKSEKAIDLQRKGEEYACGPGDLHHINRYPFFADLPTSSKQGKKISNIVSMLRAEKEARGLRPGSVLT